MNEKDFKALLEEAKEKAARPDVKEERSLAKESDNRFVGRVTITEEFDAMKLYQNYCQQKQNLSQMKENLKSLLVGIERLEKVIAEFEPLIPDALKQIKESERDVNGSVQSGSVPKNK